MMRRIPAVVSVVLLAPLAALGAGCSATGGQEPHGSPVLLSVWWIAGGAQTLVWSADPDAATAPAAPAAATEIDFVFDRRLDGARIEDTVGNTTVPKANPPITVSWPDAATVMSDPPFADDLFYNSLPVYGGQTAYAFLRPHAPGFPSATTVTFALDHTGLTSAYGDQMTGPTEVDVLTAPLGVILRGGSGADAQPTFPSTYLYPVAFTNRLPAPAAMAPFAHARAGGAEIPVALAADTLDPTVVYVSSTCAGGWPPGATVAVSFDAGLPDAFGVPTTAPLDAGSFLVSAAGGDAAAPTDAACTVPTDAGAD
jgi:hypothetical protein